MRFHFCIVALGLLVVPAPAAEDATAPDSLMPLAVGNRWVYRIWGQDDRLTITAVAEEKIGDVLCMRLEGRLQNRTIATEHVAVRQGGVYLYRNDGVDLDPPALICRFPAEPGDTWRSEYKLNDKKASLSYECDEEELTVPAGRFNAFVVRSESSGGAHRLKNAVWYAPKVGMVKQVITEGDTTITLSLDRFERNGDKELGPKIPKKNPK